MFKFCLDGCCYFLLGCKVCNRVLRKSQCKSKPSQQQKLTCAAIIANSCITAGIWEVFTTGRADISFFFKLIDLPFRSKKKEKKPTKIKSAFPNKFF
jgi:hypothetical protein